MESSLRQYDRLADRIKLHRQADQRATVVVEGPSDERLVAGLLPEHSVVVFVAGTRGEVLRAAAELKALEVGQIVGLVDRDFDDEVDKALGCADPVVAYDGADLEDMLMASPAAQRMVAELGSDAKLKAYGGHDALVIHARACGLVVANLRRASMEQGWALSFDQVDLAAKVDKNDLSLNVASFCRALRAASSTNIAQVDLEAAVVSGSSGICPRTFRPLVRGRDMLAVVGVALRKVAGSRTKAQTTAELLAGVLRSSSDRDWLRESDWFAELIEVGELSAA